MTRNERVLKCIDINKGAGIELGPLTAPVVSKKETKSMSEEHQRRLVEWYLYTLLLRSYEYKGSKAKV
jgi:hypothetical protein